MATAKDFIFTSSNLH